MSGKTRLVLAAGDAPLVPLEPIREVWIHDEAFAAGSRLSMMRLIQANVLSTIHLLDKTSKPMASGRFTISSFHVPVRHTTSAIFSPA